MPTTKITSSTQATQARNRARRGAAPLLPGPLPAHEVLPRRKPARSYAAVRVGGHGRRTEESEYLLEPREVRAGGAVAACDALVVPGRPLAGGLGGGGRRPGEVGVKERFDELVLGEVP